MRQHAISRRELASEVGRLRGVIGLDKKWSTFETWAEHAPQHLRDQIAASAYVAEKLNAPRALMRLGFKLKPDSYGHFKPEEKELASRIFGTPGVQAILASDAKKVEDQREALQARLVQIGLHADNSEAVRATELLSRMVVGWRAGDKEVADALRTDARQMNVFLLAGHSREKTGEDTEQLNNPDRVVDAVALLAHEPGDPVTVPDDELPR